MLSPDRPPPGLEYQAAAWQKLRDNFDGHWNYMKKIISRMPKQAMTQGVGSVISRAPFLFVVADSPRKSVAIANGFNDGITEKATISGVQAAPNSVIILDQSAGSKLNNRQDCFTVNLDPNLSKMFSDDSLIEAFVKRALGEGLNPWKIAAILNEPLEKIEEVAAKLRKIIFN